MVLKADLSDKAWGTENTDRHLLLSHHQLRSTKKEKKHVKKTMPSVESDCGGCYSRFRVHEITGCW
jgi:hypothetical protein